MNLRNFYSKNVVLRLSDILKGESIYYWLQFLQKSQYWTRNQIDTYQNNRLRFLIQHAYNNVPFYRNLFLDLRIKPSDIQTKEDLKKLPVITKDDLKKSKGMHLAQNINTNKLIYASSSGSTGEPFQYYRTKTSDSFIKAAAIRGWNWMGYNLGDPYVKVSMNPRHSLLKRVQDFMNNSLYLSANQLIQEEFVRIASSIEDFDPKFLRCYPVPLYFLAQQIEQEGKYKGKSLQAINTTGSTLSACTREKIESAFNVKIYDSYSCEGGAIFFECNTHHCYHPAEEYAIQEFIEDSFTLSDPEKPLRHITTDLVNLASPFIRYDTQDYVVLNQGGSCPCGRHFHNISKIKGRDSDILITPGGKYLIVENFVAYFEWITEVDQIQIVQEKSDKIVFNLVINKAFTENTMTKLRNYWQEYIGSDITLEFNIVDSIKLTPTGKRRTIIRNSEIKIPALDG